MGVFVGQVMNEKRRVFSFFNKHVRDRFIGNSTKKKISQPKRRYVMLRVTSCEIHDDVVPGPTKEIHTYIHTYVSRALCRVTRKTKKTSEWKYFEENDWGVVQIIKQNVLYLSKFIYLLIFINALIIKKIRSLLKFDLAGRDCWRGRAVLLSRGVRSRWRHPGVPAVMSGRHVGSTWAAPRATW